MGGVLTQHLAEPVMVADATEARFDAFVRVHRDKAVALAWQLTGGDRSAAEDIVQEAFLRAYQGLDGFRDASKLSTWFYRIVVRQAHNHRRWRSVRERGQRLLRRTPSSLSPPTSDFALQRRILQALDTLPRGQREVFVLVHLQDFTVREASETLGKALGTVKSHLHRALARLRRELDDLEETP